MPENIEEALCREFGQKFVSGSTVFREGDPGDRVYIIQNGQVEISKSVGKETKVLAVLSRGDFFGEMALISDKPRSATAKVLEESQLLVLEQDIFLKILRSNYEITRKLIEQLVSRLDEANQQLENLLFSDHTSRLVGYFDKVEVDKLTMSIDTLATELGVSEERLQRIVGKLEEKGLLRASDKSIEILDRSKLSKLKNYLISKTDKKEAG